MSSTVKQAVQCTHCGEPCHNGNITLVDKIFCCEGCRMVYEIINDNGLCRYYNLNDRPGITQKDLARRDKFAFLDDGKIAAKLISFKDENQTHITFYLPQMHCSSCLYLLENLHKLHAGVVSAKVNFTRKEADIVFENTKASLRDVAELLTAVGYEPYISLNDLKETRPAMDRTQIVRLGIAGFCFSNIMLMSFPDYLGIDASEEGIRGIFRIANLLLSLPVFFYAALPFYESSWKGIKHKFLNIDIPIALAIIITFIRSVWEVFSGAGGGYFDSMTGIVFFMLAGRVVQDKTYRQLSFDRDYSSYFPVAVSVWKDKKEIPTLLPEIKVNDTMLIHHGELIPADGLIIKGKALIDYSFVTGESLPVPKEIGEMVYAGGKQTEGNIEVMVIKEVNQSYLTSLWNKEDQPHKQKSVSFVHRVSKYFTGIVILIAGLAAAYWAFHDPSRIWTAVTAVFIIACPCALLLSNSFTNGHILNILGRNRFYLRKASVLEDIAHVDHIVFDKTGTLTSAGEQEIGYEGQELTDTQISAVVALASCSNHPLSKALAAHFPVSEKPAVQGFKEYPGKGIEGFVNDHWLWIGAAQEGTQKKIAATTVHIRFENQDTGKFLFSNHYRKSVPELLQTLGKSYRLSVISGDNNAEMQRLRRLTGDKTTLLFHQKPEDKLHYIQSLQQKGEKVMMIGDGLNDAGALKQSDAGIAVSEQSNNFTPASDGIIAAKQLPLLDKFIRLSKMNRKIVLASFALSVLYNVIGLYFAVQADLSPLIAAILMPSSSLSIVLLSFGASNIGARLMRLEW
ncbi:MAG: ATPase [Sphingobacteriales bacterium 44-15]|nr:MAG: ATPase [Sphingobacteriales bacterium 44-15]